MSGRRPETPGRELQLERNTWEKELFVLNGFKYCYLTVGKRMNNI